MTDFTGILVAAGIGAVIGYGSVFLTNHFRTPQKAQRTARSAAVNPHALALLLAVIMGAAFAVMSWL